MNRPNRSATHAYWKSVVAPKLRASGVRSYVRKLVRSSILASHTLPLQIDNHTRAMDTVLRDAGYNLRILRWRAVAAFNVDVSRSTSRRLSRDRQPRCSSPSPSLFYPLPPSRRHPSLPTTSALTYGANAFLKSSQPFGEDATCDEFARELARVRFFFFG